MLFRSLSLVGVAASPALPEPRQGEGDVGGLPATTFHGLPRRVRPDKPSQEPEQDHQAGRAREAAPTDAPAPDDARRLAASLQRSWHRSRADDDTADDDTADGDATEVGEPDGSPRGGWAPDNGGWAPDKEEEA